MSQEPVESKIWGDSKTLKYLVFTFLGNVFLQLIPMLQAKQIDWWALATVSIVTLTGIITRMAQPDIQAPKAFNFLNSSNLPLRIDQK